jgi:SNF2-related domain
MFTCKRIYCCKCKHVTYARTCTCFCINSLLTVVLFATGIMLSDSTRSKDNVVPPLLGVNFWRVVLDESHTIRSSNSSSNAASNAVSNRRWLVSGNQSNVCTTAFSTSAQRLFEFCSFFLCARCGLQVYTAC